MWSDGTAQQYNGTQHASSIAAQKTHKTLSIEKYNRENCKTTETAQKLQNPKKTFTWYKQ